MNKARIVIASVLKPLTEPRVFTKLALSLRETNKYHLNIIGFSVKNIPDLKDIQFTPIFNNHRTHISRILAPIRFLINTLRYRPHLVIVTTYELLPAALIGKLIIPYKLVYDLQENYHQNVLLNHTVPSGIKQVIALFIQALERIAHPFIDHYFFAEASYPSEFSYIKKFTILENKYHGSISTNRKTLPVDERFSFIVSGTITPVYGIEEAIHWFVSLAQKRPGIRLKIIGHLPLLHFRKALEKLTDQHPQIELVLSDNPIPYSVLQAAIGQADIVLMPYKFIDSIRHKIPTKLYESIALQKPIFISKNPLWEKIIAPYPAGLAVDFLDVSEAPHQLNKLITLPLYQEIPRIEVSWKSEELKLIHVIHQLLR